MRQQFVQADVFGRAGFDEAAADPAVAAELVEFLAGQGRAAAVDAGGDEDLRAMGGQLAEPVVDAAQRIAGVGRVEQDQGQVGVGHVQGVDQAVIGLAGQVPQHGFAARAVGALGLQLIEHPELLAVGRGMFFEFAMRQPPARPAAATKVRTDFNPFKTE